MSVFDKRIDQRNSIDEKHDRMGNCFTRDDLLPMWVAEMDFQTAAVIIETLMKRCEHGIFGYSYRSDTYYQAIIDWYKNRHQVAITQDMLNFDTGVVKTVFELLRIFTNKHDNILVPMPAYPQFGKAIKLADREMKYFPLDECNHRYTFDFDKLEIELQACSMMILCSPHNPGGRIWSKEELHKIARLCKETNTILISDEIHCDLCMPDKKFISMLAITNECIVINSASKSFNMAGLQHSYSICPNKEMSAKITDHYHAFNIKSSNTMSMVALESAYSKGETWLNDVCAYIKDNDRMIREFIHSHKLQLPIFELEAGYLLWIDFRAYFEDGHELESFLVDECRIATSFGSNFGKEYATFTRLNIGTQKCVCEEAMNRMYSGLAKIGKL